MIQDAKWRFHVISPSVPPTLANEAIVVTGTTAYTTEHFDLKAAGYADGGSELFLRIRPTAGGASAGTGILIELLDAAAVSGANLTTPTTVFSKNPGLLTTTLVTAGAEVVGLRLPPGLKRYIALRFTGTASTDATTTFEAGIVTS